MRPFTAPVMLVLLLCAPAVAAAQVGYSLDTNRTIITTSGSARATFTPDRATVTFMIEPQAMSAEEAGNRLAAVQRAVMDTLRHFNLPASAIQSYNSGVTPYRSNMSPSAGPSFAGRSSIRVELTHLDQLPAITGAALAKGASFVSAPVYSLADLESLRRNLVPQAFQQARQNAESIAVAAGGHLGRMLEVTEMTNPSSLMVEQAQSSFISTMMYDSGQRTIPNSATYVTVSTRWLLTPASR